MKRSILVTGASSGIGRAIARNLLKQGHEVIGISRDCSQFKVPMAKFQPIQCDLGQLKELPQKIRELGAAIP